MYLNIGISVTLFIVGILIMFVSIYALHRMHVDIFTSAKDVIAISKPSNKKLKDKLSKLQKDVKSEDVKDRLLNLEEQGRNRIISNDVKSEDVIDRLVNLEEQGRNRIISNDVKSEDVIDRLVNSEEQGRMTDVVSKLEEDKNGSWINMDKNVSPTSSTDLELDIFTYIYEMLEMMTDENRRMITPVLHGITQVFASIGNKITKPFVFMTLNANMTLLFKNINTTFIINTFNYFLACTVNAINTSKGNIYNTSSSIEKNLMLCFIAKLQDEDFVQQTYSVFRGIHINLSRDGDQIVFPKYEDVIKYALNSEKNLTRSRYNKMNENIRNEHIPELLRKTKLGTFEEYKAIVEKITSGLQNVDDPSVDDMIDLFRIGSLTGFVPIFNNSHYVTDEMNTAWNNRPSD